jgi:NAD(P)-dependent dehydrogenase (short-subunit alcohol dehydrogenase family)
VSAECLQINKTVVPVQCDISSKQSLQDAVASIERQTPFVNMLIANSGMIGPVTSLPPRAADASIASIQQQFWETPHDENLQLMNVNVVGQFYTMVAFLHLLEAGNTHPDSRGSTDFIRSQLVTIGSLASFSRRENVSYAYMASKAALVHLTKAFATGFGPKGIRANCIAPGLYPTEMTEVSLIRLHCVGVITC